MSDGIWHLLGWLSRSKQKKSEDVEGVKGSAP